MALIYKCVELAVVTDESLERSVNEWVADGWTFDRAQFVTSESSRRPAMAFLWFLRDPDRPEAPPALDRPEALPKPDRRTASARKR